MKVHPCGRLAPASGAPPGPGQAPVPEENPGHALDHFFGALLPSPSGRSPLVDGRGRPPEGIPLVLDCAAWLAGDRLRTWAPEA